MIELFLETYASNALSPVCCSGGSFLKSELLLIPRESSSWSPSKRNAKNSCASCCANPLNTGANLQILLYYLNYIHLIPLLFISTLY